jgi:hypothetical protein
LTEKNKQYNPQTPQALHYNLEICFAKEFRIPLLEECNNEFQRKIFPRRRTGLDICFTFSHFHFRFFNLGLHSRTHTVAFLRELAESREFTIYIILRDGRDPLQNKTKVSEGEFNTLASKEVLGENLINKKKK